MWWYVPIILLLGWLGQKNLSSVTQWDSCLKINKQVIFTHCWEWAQPLVFCGFLSPVSKVYDLHRKWNVYVDWNVDWLPLARNAQDHRGVFNSESFPPPLWIMGHLCVDDELSWPWGSSVVHFDSQVPFPLSLKIKSHISVCLCLDLDLSHADRCGIFHLWHHGSTWNVVGIGEFQVLDFQVRDAQAVTPELAKDSDLS